MNEIHEWKKDVVILEEGSKIFISVPFTWLLPKAKQLYERYLSLGKDVEVGGPACRLMPDYLKETRMKKRDFIQDHNFLATFTSKGCNRNCSFCGVARIEGKFRELKNFIPRPIICDSNFLMSSKKHFNKVIDSLKSLKGIDFNQGLDARLLTSEMASRIAELNIVKVRFVWDRIDNEKFVFKAIELVRKAGIPKNKISVYCLVGYKDSPRDALYRAKTLIAYGITRPFFMRFQPLNCLKKNKFIGGKWTGFELRRFLRYWNNLRITAPIPYDDFKINEKFSSTDFF